MYPRTTSYESISTPLSEPSDTENISSGYKLIKIVIDQNTMEKTSKYIQAQAETNDALRKCLRKNPNILQEYNAFRYYIMEGCPIAEGKTPQDHNPFCDNHEQAATNNPLKSLQNSELHLVYDIFSHYMMVDSPIAQRKVDCMILSEALFDENIQGRLYSFDRLDYLIKIYNFTRPEQSNLKLYAERFKLEDFQAGRLPDKWQTRSVEMFVSTDSYGNIPQEKMIHLFKSLALMHYTYGITIEYLGSCCETEGFPHLGYIANMNEIRKFCGKKPLPQDEDSIGRSSCLSCLSR